MLLASILNLTSDNLNLDGYTNNVRSQYIFCTIFFSFFFL